MAYITIKIGEIGDETDYIQYQSIMAVITIDKEEYLLESRDLDNEDAEADLEVINGFVGIWEIRTEKDNIKLEIDDSVNERIVDLNMELDEDRLREQDEADMPGGF